MSVNVSVAKTRTERHISKVSKIITNSNGSDTISWVPENEASSYVTTETLDVSKNGTYTPEKGSLYDEVHVDVESTELGDLVEKTIRANGTYDAENDDGTGINEGSSSSDDSNTKVAGYKTVNVAVPLMARVIKKNGVYVATNETNAEGETIQAYSSVEVKFGDDDTGDDDTGDDGDSFGEKDIYSNGTYTAANDKLKGYSSVYVNVRKQVAQPSLDFVIKVNKNKPEKKLPFSISISDTATSDYGTYEKNHSITRAFSRAKIYNYVTGAIATNEVQSLPASPFRANQLNIGNQFCYPYPQKYWDAKNAKWNEAKTPWQSMFYGSDSLALNTSGRFDIEAKSGTCKFILAGQLRKAISGRFCLGADGGYQWWLVTGVSLPANAYYSCTITVSTSSS